MIFFRLFDQRRSPQTTSSWAWFELNREFGPEGHELRTKFRGHIHFPKIEDSSFRLFFSKSLIAISMCSAMYPIDRSIRAILIDAVDPEKNAHFDQWGKS